VYFPDFAAQAADRPASRPQRAHHRSTGTGGLHGGRVQVRHQADSAGAARPTARTLGEVRKSHGILRVVPWKATQPVKRADAPPT